MTHKTLKDSRKKKTSYKEILSTIDQLTSFYYRSGFARFQHLDRAREKDWWKSYKKGDEIRLVARSRSELATIRRLLRRAGFKPGRPYSQGRAYRQPLYGREAVARFILLVNKPD